MCIRDSIKHLGIIDYLVEKNNKDELLEELFKLGRENKSTEDIMTAFKDVLKDYDLPTKKTDLSFNEENIKKYYDKDTVFEIVSALKENKDAKIFLTPGGAVPNIWVDTKDKAKQSAISE